MLSSELMEGIELMDDDLKPLGVNSKKAAFIGISSVVLSRIGMGVPGMGKHIKKNKKNKSGLK